MSDPRWLQDMTERMGAIMNWNLAMPLVDHDGGDEDDREWETRQFLRACRKPHANLFRIRDTLYVGQQPDPLAPFKPIMFHDPGDEDRP